MCVVHDGFKQSMLDLVFSLQPPVRRPGWVLRSIMYTISIGKSNGRSDLKYRYVDQMFWISSYRSLRVYDLGCCWIVNTLCGREDSGKTETSPFNVLLLKP